MKLYHTKELPHGLIGSIVVFAAVLCLFWFGFTSTSDSNRAESLKVTRAAIEKAVVSCYAIEGVYPPDIKYLEDHYGVMINHDQYIVTYETAGSNIMPSIQVLEKGKEAMQ